MRAPASSLLAGVLAIVVAVVVTGVVVGCSLPFEETTCTLIGCGDTITIDLGEVADEGFVATVESPLASGGFSCSAPEQTNEGSVASMSPTDLSGDFAGDEASVFVTCTEDGFLLAMADDGEPPAAITVEATGASSGSVVSDTFEDIQYTVSQPNGPDCEPTCYQTTLIVSGS